MIDRFKSVFHEESLELLNGLEELLLQLEANPTDPDLISAVFRSMHTIKGSAGMFGFVHVQSFAHEAETVLDLVRSGKLVVRPELVSLTLKARDQIRRLLEAGETPDEDCLAASASLIREFREINAERSGTVVSTVKSATPSDGRSRLSVYRILFRPSTDLLRNGTNPLRLLDEVRTLGDTSCLVHSDGIPKLDDLKVFDLYVSWDLILTSDRSLDEIKDVFVFVEDQSSVDIRVIDDLEELEAPAYKRLGEILVDRGVIKANELDDAIRQQRRLGEVLVATGTNREEINSALEEQDHVRRARGKIAGELTQSSVRVNAEKLDRLVDLVGELVTLQARLGETVGSASTTSLEAINENLERLIADLRDSTLSMRMLAVGTTFSKFRRLTRDLSGELGKEVDLIAEGGETQLDKTVLERLNDPLIHIVRNAIDHGIEAPAAREAAGKPRRGTLRLTAVHSGANVLLRIEDDGAGLDAERIRVKAVERGLVPEGQELSEAEAFNLLFLPGFSTAESLTTVSGRGVGMDVVKKAVDSLGGSIALKSEPGRSTVVLLSIPLTLAIIEGLLVQAGDDEFIIPLGVVLQCIELRRSEKSPDARILNNRGEILPFLRLRDVFRIPGSGPDVEQVVVVTVGDGRTGIVVDRVIGDHQTVIKNLGRMYQGTVGVSGATIKGNGRVALILDVPRLVEAVARTA